jgi:sulfur transfer protein SufE
MDYNEIRSLLSAIDDPITKLEAVMDLGKELPQIPQDAACADIAGCASRVQICNTGGIFYGAADSALVRGIVAIILSMANGGVSDLRSEFESLNLNLGAGRLNGVNAIICFLDKHAFV